MGRKKGSGPPDPSLQPPLQGEETGGQVSSHSLVRTLPWAGAAAVLPWGADLL